MNISLFYFYTDNSFKLCFVHTEVSHFPFRLYSFFYTTILLRPRIVVKGAGVELGTSANVLKSKIISW